MAAHESISSYSLDFASDTVQSNSLTYLFELAARNAPALVVFEDLDRVYAPQRVDGERLPRIPLQQLLGCLDGLASADGVIVVATANDITNLDPALIRRPGRFDRLVRFDPPKEEARRTYFSRVVSTGHQDDLDRLVSMTDGLSFAQLREVYVSAGQAIYSAGRDRIGHHDLIAAAEMLVTEIRAARGVSNRGVGFGV